MFVRRAVCDDRCLMSGRSPGPGRSLSGAAGVPCMCLLQRCLAVQLQRVSLVDPRRAPPTSEPPQQQYWMYDSGYLIFQVSSSQHLETERVTSLSWFYLVLHVH